MITLLCVVCGVTFRRVDLYHCVELGDIIFFCFLPADTETIARETHETCTGPYIHGIYKYG
jgi:hypothetical protein